MAVTKRGEVSSGFPAAAAAVRRLVLPVACALSVAGCASTAATGTHQASSGGVKPAATANAPTPTPPSLPPAGTIAATYTGLGGVSGQGDTEGIGVDASSVWIYDGATGVLTRLARDSGAVQATVKLSPSCGDGIGCGNLAIGDGAVWLANTVAGTVTRVDPATNKVVATITVGPARSGAQVYTTPGAVWSANYFTDTYTRIDPRTNRITATLTQHSRPEAVASAGGSVWLCDSGGDPALTRIDSNTNAVQAQIDLTTAQRSSVFCLDAVPLGASVYAVTDGNPSPPQMIDTATGKAAEVASPPGTELVERGVATGADGGWVIDAQQGLFRLDPHTGAPVAQLAISGAVGVADDGHSVWVITGAGTLYRVTPA